MLKSSYLLAGMRFGMLARLVRRNGVTFRPRYLVRLLFLMQGGLWTSLLVSRERRKLGAVLDRLPPVTNPIFIISHWRTGSTFLHQLMSLDPALAAPTNYQCCYPESFITSRPFAEPVLSPFLRGHRPMDNVKVGFDEPHEDEYALMRMSGFSPLERLVFPRGKRYFLLDDETFLPPPADMSVWEEAMLAFAAKLAFHTNRRPVFKNPFHALRLPVLKRLFPDALYIHIFRNPLVVIPSTIHMWRIFGEQNALRAGGAPPTTDEVATVYARVLARIRADLADIPAGRRFEIRFEDFEQDPLAALRMAYTHLRLPFSEELGLRLEAKLAEIRGYEKNRYEWDARDEELIRSRLADHMRADGYR